MGATSLKIYNILEIIISASLKADPNYCSKSNPSRISALVLQKLLTETYTKKFLCIYLLEPVKEIIIAYCRKLFLFLLLQQNCTKLFSDLFKSAKSQNRDG